jgi:hypothetical protein
LTVVLISLALVGKSFAQDTTSLLIIRNIPIILGAINNKPAYFLIDTGASITMLNESVSSTYKFKVVNNLYFAGYEIVGMGGRTFIKEVRTARLRLGIHELNFINKASDLEGISEQFADSDIIIAGIIGTDVLYALGSKIDLEARIIVFK